MGPIRAIYENGMFKPTAPVSLPEGALVTFEPRPVEPPPEPDEDYDPATWERMLAWVESLKNRTDEELEEVRRRGVIKVPLSDPFWSVPQVPPATGLGRKADEPGCPSSESLP